MIELLVALALLGSGFGVLRPLSGHVSPWFLVAAAYPVGLAVQMLLAWGWLLIGAPLNVALLIAGTVACGIGVAVAARGRPFQRAPWPAVLAGVASATIIVGLSLVLHGAKLTFDSLQMVELASGAAGGARLTELPPWVLLTRPIGPSLLHLSAALEGAHFLQSLHQLLGAAAVATSAAVTFDVARRLDADRPMARLASLAVGAFLATPYFMVWQLFFVNSHVMFGVVALLLVHSAWLQAEHDIPAGYVTAFMVAALVPLRLESPVLIPLFIIPVLAHGAIRTRAKTAVALAFVGPTIVWYGWLRLQDTGGRILDIETVDQMIAIAIATGLFAAALRWTPLGRLGQHIPWLLVAASGLAVVGMVVLRPQHMLESAGAVWLNIYHAGQWGLTWIALLLAVPVALTVGRLPSRWIWRTPLLAVPLVTFGLSFMRTPYRLGFGDSMNRMLTHILFVAAVYVAVAATSVLARGARATGGDAPS